MVSGYCKYNVLEGNDNVWIILLANCTGYQNRLNHKQQPADGAAPGRHVVAPQVICSKPQPQVSG